jgi:hypothetical protein
LFFKMGKKSPQELLKEENFGKWEGRGVGYVTS